MNNDVVILQLDRPRQLKFGYTALKTLVELTGKTIEEIDKEIDVSNFELIATMVYCGTLRDAKDNGEILKPEQLPDLLDNAPSFVHVVDKLAEAWRAALVPASSSAAEGNQESPGM